MLTQTLRRILTLSPKGRTTLQFVRLLESASIRANRADVYASLDEMRRKGLVFIDRGGYWHLGSKHAGPSGPDEAAPDFSGEARADAPLLSIQLRRMAEPDPADEPAPAGETAGRSSPPLKALLSYYQSTQVADQRGPVSYPLSAHEDQFQIFRAPRRWWNPDSTLTIELESLPPTFRFALSKRRGEPVVVGYPLEIVAGAGGPEAVPVGLIAATLSRSGYSMELTPQARGAILNPDWIAKTANGVSGGIRGIVEQFAGVTDLDFDEFCEVLSGRMEARQAGRLEPNSLAGTIDPETLGICNAAAILLPNDEALKRQTAADLGALAQMPEGELKDTALWRLLKEDETQDLPGLVTNPVPLTPNQFEATQLAATGAVTAITAPPGTGKSHVIVSLIASAIAQSKSVLMVSRNGQAIDEVNDLLDERVPGNRLIVRADGQSEERAADFVQVMADLVADRTRPNPEVIGGDLQELRAKAEERARVCRDYLQARRRHCNLSHHVERRAEILARVGDRPTGVAGMISLSRKRKTVDRDSLPEVLAPGAVLDEIDAAIERDRAFLDGLETGGDPVALGEDVLALAGRIFPQLVANALAVDPVDRQQIHTEQERYSSPELIDLADVPERIARVVTGCQPVWAVNPDTASARVPLVPGLFDYVIFVDGNVSDIASAVPLLARGRQAVIFGDPDQLDILPRLDAAQEGLLLEENELSAQTMDGYLQSGSTLFDFAAARPATGTAILRDQFRSAPAIVDYLNDHFYHGRIRSCRDVSGLKLPGAVVPGISWTDVRGRVSQDRYGQPRNHDEADAITAHIEYLITQTKFDGSIGVVSPFRAQVSLIRRLVDEKIPRELQESAGLEIALTGRFQGQAKDIILFSPVAAAGIAESAMAFLMDDRRHFSTSIGRARTLAHVFGDPAYAQRPGSRPLAGLAKAAAAKRGADNPEGGFVSKWQHRVNEALQARGISPSPHYPVGGRYLDFALFGDKGIKLDLEVDGRQSLADPDNQRKFENVWWDHQLKDQGWKVRRFWVHELEQDMEKCLDQVERDLAG